MAPRPCVVTWQMLKDVMSFAVAAREARIIRIFRLSAADGERVVIERAMAPEAIGIECYWPVQYQLHDLWRERVYG